MHGDCQWPGEYGAKFRIGKKARKLLLM